MPSPFPGMDPYLEAPGLWPDLHHRLIAAISDALAPQVAPTYFVRVEQRAYILQLDDFQLVGRPDLAIIGVGGHVAESAALASYAAGPQTVSLPTFEQTRESYLEIHSTSTQEVITVIEVLSPSNKAAGVGRREYEAKRREVLSTYTSLVEIDLLRAGEPMEMHPVPRGDYRILVRRGWELGRGHVHSFSVRQPMPEVGVPLRQGEEEARLCIRVLLADIYDRARYDLSLDYRGDADPPLVADDKTWADGWLRERGLR